MYELFLTATVRRDDFTMACAILQGLTWMEAREEVHRVLYFAGPPQPQPRGLPSNRCFRQSGPAAAPLWNELAKQLARSSYVLQLDYEVFRDTDFGGAAAGGGDGSSNGDEGKPPAVGDLNAAPGTLRWTDLPDPLRDTPVIQRKKIEIPDQRNLPAAMADNGHTFKGELIRETHSYVRTNVEFVFSRTYHLPASHTQQAAPPGKQPPLQQPQPLPTLPAWDDLRPVDPAQKWILNVRLQVDEDNQPDKLQKANKELLAVKEELDRLFEFKVVDRRVLDTRIAPPPVVPPR